MIGANQNLQDGRVLVLSRRKFMGLLGVSVASATLAGISDSYGAKANTNQQPGFEYGGADLSGWTTVLGDGLFHQPDEPPPALSDIATTHFGDHSELSANIHARDIMAHNITLYRINDEEALEYLHTCGFKFRLPYLPASTNTGMNPQTIEGGLAIWDGANKRLDHHIAFQWRLNPWHPEYKTIAIWSDEIDAGVWKVVSALEPDIEWHHLRIVMDFRRRAAGLSIDGANLPALIASTTKPSSWGPETSARLMAEIISIDPGLHGHGRLHKAEFKDWYWIWEDRKVCDTFLPAISNG